MKKSVFCFILAVLMVVMVLPLGNATAYAATVEYAVTSGSVFFDPQTGLIIGHSGDVTAVTIPGEINGVKVLGIGDGAFEACYSLREFTLPEGIQSIGSAAFYECDNLKSINLPDSVVEIGPGAFYSCRGLEHVVIPEGIKTISAWAFGHCHGLQSVAIPKGVTTIEESAFFSCESLTEVVIPEGVNTIGNAAFSWCRAMTDVTIPAGVVTIGDHAFSYCYSLRSADLPEGVTSIGSSAFSYGYDLTSVTIPVSLTKIGATAFEYCGSNMNLYYSGSEAQWLAIDQEGNDFANVLVHFAVSCQHTYETNKVKPTCTEDGFTTYTCTLCGDAYTADHQAALGHDISVVGGKAPTCEDIGWEDYETCSRCGHSTYKELTALGHEERIVVTEATCVAGGSTARVCDRCGKKETIEETDALGHAWDEGKVTTQSTEEKEGVRTFTCTRCEEEKTESIPKKEHVHDYAEAVTLRTCTEAGYTTHTCRCGDRYTDGETDALGHAWDAGKVTTQPTEENEGVRTFTCIRCEEEKNESIPKKEHVHSYTAVITSPTCTEVGYTTHTCACGESFKDAHTDPLKHSYTDGLCIRCEAADPDYEEPGHICPSAKFTDVPIYGNWAHDGIDYCVKHELMNGTGGDLFNPNGTVSRAQLVTILYRVAGTPETEFKGTFTDVPSGQWYSEAIEWAAANGVVNGIGNGKFGPDLSITREQIATILYRYEKEPAVSGNLNSFPDHGKVNNFAANGLIWATQEGLINGISSNGITTLAPQNNATRAQIASIIMRYLAE